MVPELQAPLMAHKLTVYMHVPVPVLLSLQKGLRSLSLLK